MKSLSTISESSEHYSFVDMKKSDQLLEIFSLKKMKENGRLDRMWKIYGKSLQKDCQSVSGDQKPLAIKDVFMPFVFLGSVAIVALVLLKVEKLREKGRELSKNQSQQMHVEKKCNYCTAPMVHN